MRTVGVGLILVTLSCFGCLSDDSASVGAKTADVSDVGFTPDARTDAGGIASDQMLNTEDAGTETDVGLSLPLTTVIQDIQRGEIVEGTVVEVTSAVVTGVMENEGFFISDGTDEPYSGIYVYFPNPSLERIEISQQVTFVGEVVEYFGLTELVIAEGGEVTIYGEGFLPDAAIVSAEEFCDVEVIEPWEGVLISVEHVLVEQIGNGGGLTLRSRIHECVLNIEPRLSLIELGRFFVGQDIARLTGVLHFVDGIFSILPRSNTDIVTVPLATGAVTISEIRDGDIPLQSRVTVLGASVLAVDDFYLYVADPAGGARSGLRILDRYRDVVLKVGDKVDVDITVLSSEEARLTQARIVGQAIGPSPTPLTREQMNDRAYLYTLVTLQDLNVTNPKPERIYVESPEGGTYYGNPRAAFETNIAVIGNEFWAYDNPFVRVGDQFAGIVGVRTQHQYEWLDDGEVINLDVPAVAPRGSQDLVDYDPYCEADVCAGALAEGDLVFTEISYDGVCEWVEIFNTRTESIDLTNLKIGERASMGVGSYPFTFSGEVILGQSFAVVGCLPMCVNAVAHIESDLGGALANEGDTIELWAADLVLDSVTFQPSRTGGRQLNPGTITGHSGVEIARQNDDPNYWCESVGFSQCGSVGTPGLLNRCEMSCLPDRCASDLRSGDLMITELLPDPVGGNSACEWIELYNSTEQTIELAGLLLADGSEPDLFRMPNLMAGRIEAGSYAIIMKDAAACDSPCMPEPIASWQRFASLNNGGDTLTLAYLDRVLETLTYANASSNGASVQRADLADELAFCSPVDGGDQCGSSTPNQPNLCQ